jgi:hypothetical protein
MTCLKMRAVRQRIKKQETHASRRDHNLPPGCRNIALESQYIFCPLVLTGSDHKYAGDGIVDETTDFGLPLRNERWRTDDEVRELWNFS